MKKDTFIGIASIAILLLALAAYALLHPLAAKAPGALDTSGLPAGSYAEHTQYFDISAHYATSTPITSVSTAADAGAVAAMKNFVGATITQFKTDGNFANLTPEDIKIMGFDTGRKETLDIVYLLASSKRTVSYIFTIYEDTLGAHGNTFFHTFTFDSRTGAPLTLSDLFLPETAYLDKLTAVSRAALPAVIGVGADNGMMANGTTPDEKNFQNFFFDNTDFVILFDPYAVAPYAAGPQTLRIPTSQLSNILKPEYR